MEIPPGAFDLAVQQYLLVLDEEVLRGNAGALVEYQALLAWQEEREAAVAEAFEAAWED